MTLTTQRWLRDIEMPQGSVPTQHIRIIMAIPQEYLLMMVVSSSYGEIQTPTKVNRTAYPAQPQPGPPLPPGQSYSPPPCLHPINYF